MQCFLLIPCFPKAFTDKLALPTYLACHGLVIVLWSGFFKSPQMQEIVQPCVHSEGIPIPMSTDITKNVNHRLKIAFLSTNFPLVSSAVTFKSSSFWCFPQEEIFFCVKGKLVWQEFWKIHCLPFTKGWSSNCRAEGRSCWSLHWGFEKSVHKMNMHSCNVIICKI